MAYASQEARQDLLASIAEAIDEVGRAMAALGDAYDQLDEHTAEERTQRRARSRDGGVDAEHARTLTFLEQRDRQRRSATQRQRDADALQHAAQHEQRIGRRCRTCREAQRAYEQPELEDAAVAQEVAEPAEYQHQAGVGQHVGDHDPANVPHLQREGLGDAGKGDVDGAVERRGDGAEPDDEEAGSRT